MRNLTVDSDVKVETARDTTAQETELPEAISLIIEPSSRTVTLKLKKEILLGRPDPSSGIYPDVDLAPDGGLEQGVSRRHSRISRSEKGIVIEDLGSVNGTFCNGKRLLPYQAQILQDGDELLLGKLLIRVRF
jgi:pSer/pThr/pTyr-binding forkhead associated (FHA) protein